VITRRSDSPRSLQSLFLSEWFDLAHDNVIAIGFHRYSYAAEAATLHETWSRGIFCAEPGSGLCAGQERKPSNFRFNTSEQTCRKPRPPAPFAFLQAMPGIRPDASGDRLYVDPALPDWLPDITLTDMKIGRPRFDLRFSRDGRDTQWEVLRGEAGLVAALRPGNTCNWEFVGSLSRGRMVSYAVTAR
jgi:hypothetical protein